MSVCLSRGVLTVSIDLEPDVTRLGLAQQRSVDRVTQDLLQLMGRYQLPGTWAVADPAVSAATECITSHSRGHEIAISGDATWVGREAGRGRFGRELARRVVRGRGAGIALTTLVLNAATLDEHADSAIKQGITAMHQAVPSADDKAGQRSRAQALRFGLWTFGVTHFFPGRSRWLPGGGGGRAARFAIDQAIAARGLVQLSVDAPALAARNGAQRVLETVLQHADRRRRQGVLDVATLAATAARLSDQYRGKPSRSILRVA